MDLREILRQNGDATGRELERGRDRGDEAGAPLSFANHELPDALVARRGRAKTLRPAPHRSPDRRRRGEVVRARHARDQAGIDRGRELHSPLSHPSRYASVAAPCPSSSIVALCRARRVAARPQPCAMCHEAAVCAGSSVLGDSRFRLTAPPLLGASAAIGVVGFGLRCGAISALSRCGRASACASAALRRRSWSCAFRGRFGRLSGLRFGPICGAASGRRRRFEPSSGCARAVLGLRFGPSFGACPS